MTPEEHELMTRMFNKQFRYLELLLRILQSRDLLEDGDIGAFLALVNDDQARNASSLLAVKGDYLRAAKDIGLKVTFPKGD